MVLILFVVWSLLLSLSTSSLCGSGRWSDDPVPAASYGKSVLEDSVEKPDETPDEWLARSCPLMTMLQFNCFKLRDRERAKRVDNRHWVPSDHCHNFNPHHFLTTFTNKTVFFVGDSVTAEIFIFFVCGLYESSRSTNMTISGASMGGHSETIPSCNFPNPWNCYHANSFDISFPEYSLNMHLRLLTFGLYERGVLNRDVGWTNENTVVILNFGLHYNEYAGKPALDPDAFDLNYWLKQSVSDLVWLDQGRGASFYYLETTPQHFNGTNANGYWSGNSLGSRCIPHNLTAIAGNSTNDVDWRSKAVSQLVFPSDKFHHIRVAEELHSQWDQHVDGDMLPTENPPPISLGIDCTHFCFHSGAMRYVRQVLYNHLVWDAMDASNVL